MMELNFCFQSTSELCNVVICIIYDAMKIMMWLFSMWLDNYEIDLLACLFIYVDEVELISGVHPEEFSNL